MWTSPEVIMETPWNTATDIWSFGTVVRRAPAMSRSGQAVLIYPFQLISLIYGGNFNLFRPKTVSFDHEEYGLEVLKRQFQYFGPFPEKYQEIASPETIAAILYFMDEIPQSQTTPFSRTTEKEVCRKDKKFIGEIMMLDWRDRPTAKELLENVWFEEVD